MEPSQGHDHESKLTTGSSTSTMVKKPLEITVEEPGRATREMWLGSLKGKEEDRTNSMQQDMHKVPAMFLANEKSKTDYKPAVVSLGPYHWGNVKLKPFQDRKLSMAGRLIPDKTLENSLRKKMRSNIDKLKKAYLQERTNQLESSDEWEEMLFLDGCFVLYFIFCVMYNRVEDLKMMKCDIDLVHNDLFLLENQLPYQLLKILSGNDPELLGLVSEYICAHKISNDLGWVTKQEDEPVHLLDCLRTIIIGRRSEPKKRGGWRKLLPAMPRAGIKGTVLRHAKELTAKGIHLKPNRSGFLKDIFFWSHFIYGTLRLPRIIVDHSTRPLFLNLAAYEMCAGVDSVVTSYICFLDSLVNHAEDIKELQSAGILVNHLPTDEEAAKLFNEMSEGLRPDADAYMDVKRKIQKFFEHKTKASLASWIAEGYHNHFRSPLTAMAVLAASMALCLAATQTYFTVFPRVSK